MIKETITGAFNEEAVAERIERDFSREELESCLQKEFGRIFLALKRAPPKDGNQFYVRIAGNHGTAEEAPECSAIIEYGAETRLHVCSITLKKSASGSDPLLYYDVGDRQYPLLAGDMAEKYKQAEKVLAVGIARVAPDRLEEVVRIMEQGKKALKASPFLP